MALPIEDYAIIGDTQTAALVGRDGSIDWLCLPRFDSGAVFAALLGTEEHGRWRLAPAADDAGGPTALPGRHAGPGDRVRHRRRQVRLIDFMPPRGEAPDLVRIVEGVRGRVPMRMELRMRFDYGRVVPWVYREDGDLVAVAGPDAVWLRTPVRPAARTATTVRRLHRRPGDVVPFVLTWRPSHLPPPRAARPDRRARRRPRGTGGTGVRVHATRASGGTRWCAR